MELIGLRFMNDLETPKVDKTFHFENTKLSTYSLGREAELVITDGDRQSLKVLRFRDDTENGIIHIEMRDESHRLGL